jgi:hypothetical protein
MATTIIPARSAVESLVGVKRCVDDVGPKIDDSVEVGINGGSDIVTWDEVEIEPARTDDSVGVETNDGSEAETWDEMELELVKTNGDGEIRWVLELLSRLGIDAIVVPESVVGGELAAMERLGSFTVALTEIWLDDDTERCGSIPCFPRLFLLPAVATAVVSAFEPALSILTISMWPRCLDEPREIFGEDQWIGFVFRILSRVSTSRIFRGWVDLIPNHSIVSLDNDTRAVCVQLTDEVARTIIEWWPPHRTSVRVSSNGGGFPAAPDVLNWG